MMSCSLNFFRNRLVAATAIRVFNTTSHDVTFRQKTVTPSTYIAKRWQGTTQGTGSNNSKILEAEDFFTKNEYAKSLDLADAILGQDTENHAALALRAFCLFKLAKEAEAFKAAEIASEKDPKNDSLFRLRGMLLGKRGKVAEGLQLLNTAFRMNPSSPYTHLERANLLRLSGDKPPAILACTKALELDPMLLEAQNLKAVLLCETGKHKEGIAEWDTALRLHSGTNAAIAAIIDNKAKCLLSLDMHDEVVVTLKTALDRPGFHRTSSILFMLGESLFQLGRFGEAAAAFKETVFNEPAHAMAMVMQAQCENNMGDLVSALSCIEEACKLHTEILSWQHLRASILHKLARYSDCLSVLDAVLASKPSGQAVASIHSLRGMVLMQGFFKKDEALAAFDAALSIDPANFGALVFKAGLLDDLNKHEEALVFWEKAVDSPHSTSSTLTNQGKCLFKLKRLDEAVVCFEKATHLNPHDAEVYKVRGVCMFHLGKKEEAFDMWTKGSEIDSEDIQMHFLRAMYLHQINQNEDALKVLDIVEELSVEQGMPLEVAELRKAVIASLAEEKS